MHEFPEKFGKHCCFCSTVSAAKIAKPRHHAPEPLHCADSPSFVLWLVPAARAANSPALKPAPTAPKKVIIDTDPGTDDALAIMLALTSPDLDVRAITVVPGNVDAKQGLENALKLASLAGRCDITVAGGAQHPLFQKLITAQFWHGANGFANVDLPRHEM